MELLVQQAAKVRNLPLPAFIMSHCRWNFTSFDEDAAIPIEKYKLANV